MKAPSLDADLVHVPKPPTLDMPDPSSLEKGEVCRGDREGEERRGRRGEREERRRVRGDVLIFWCSFNVYILLPAMKTVSSPCVWLPSKTTCSPLLLMAQSR